MSDYDGYPGLPGEVYRGNDPRYAEVECRICRSTVYRPVPMVERMWPTAICADPDCRKTAANSVRSWSRQMVARALNDEVLQFALSERLRPEPTQPLWSASLPLDYGTIKVLP